MKEALDEMKEKLEQIETMLRFSEIYGGHIRVEDELITTQQLRDMREEIKFEIAAEQSKNNLRLL